MAVFVTDCPICQRRISDDTLFIATSGCAFPPDHQLFPFCDAGLHQECLRTWKHRREFATAYFESDATTRLLETDEWWIGTGPFMYGPNGNIDFPYYVAARFRDWPIRLYSKFAEWHIYVANRDWQRTCITQLNQYIASYIGEMPGSHEELLDLLAAPVIRTLTNASEHRSRYIAVLSLGLLGDSRIRAASDALTAAMHDAHGSVRQAASTLLKRLQTVG